jgi:hypothetical protein
MQLVLRPVNDQFLNEIVFPIMEMGMVSSEVALTRLRPQIADERVGMLVESLLDRGAAHGTALWGLDTDMWLEIVHQLLFWDWTKAPDGWRLKAEYPGFAADWRQMLHLALMIENPHYPYDDAATATQVLEEMTTVPAGNLGLASFFAGHWDPGPRFPAHEVLSTIPDRGRFKGDECVADWSYRPASTVSFWVRQLPTKLGRLLKREETRLQPVVVPEARRLLDYWNGTSREVPPLSVAFSGLGVQSERWVMDIGLIAEQVRQAAAAGQGLSMILTRSTRMSEDEFL